MRKARNKKKTVQFYSYKILKDKIIVIVNNLLLGMTNKWDYHQESTARGYVGFSGKGWKYSIILVLVIYVYYYLYITIYNTYNVVTHLYTLVYICQFQLTVTLKMHN